MIEINNKRLCECCFSEITAEPCGCCGYDKRTYINDPSVLPCGSILFGHYIVGRTLGKGGFGITYLAYDIKTDKTIAIKEFFPNGLANRAGGNTVTVSTAEDAAVFQNGAEKFYNEARLVARFNGNPCIVSVHEFFYENATVYFSMEYLHGKTLKNHIDQNGPITEAQAVSIADSVSTALLAAHSANVMHRDISPDNIMLCDDGTVKIIDFGAARQFVSQGSQNLSVILKQGFAPIEQYQKKGKQGPWTDIYSLGATLYYALTLDMPDDPMSRMENDEEFQSNRFGISPALWQLITTATMLKAADRYQDIFLFRKALAETGITPEPIIAPREDSFPPAGEYRTAQPVTSFNRSAAATAVPLTSALNAPAQTPVSAPAPMPATAAVEPVSAPVSAPDIPLTAPAEPAQTPVSAPAEPDPMPVTAAIVEPAQAPASAPAKPAPMPVTAAAAEPAPESAGKKPINRKLVLLINIAAVCAAVVIIAIVLVNVLKNREDISEPVSPSISQSADTPTPVTTPKSTTTTTAKPEQKPEELTEVNIGGKKYPVDAVELDLSHRLLATSDLANLRYMTKLEHINLSDNYIDDLSVLGNIPTLKEIDADNNSVSDISFAKKLPNLEILVMNNNSVSDIQPLAGCDNLQKLWMCGNKVTSIYVLRDKDMLEIGLDSCPVSDITALNGMSNLYQLNMGNCGITDISALATCTSLETVYLSFNKISDYTALTKLKNLSEVYLDGNIMTTDSIYSLSGIWVSTGLYIREMGITEDMIGLLKVYTDSDGAAIAW